VIRLLKNALRYLTGGWEKPARADWWERVLREVGFEEVRIETRHHEGGVACAVKPAAVQAPLPTDGVVLPGA
jgi:hypothetical protein